MPLAADDCQGECAFRSHLTSRTSFML